MTETETSVDSVVLSPMLQKWLDDVSSLWEEIGKRDTRIVELNAQLEAERQVDPAVVEELNRRNGELASEVAEHVTKAEALRTSISDLRGKIAQAAADLSASQGETRDAAEDASKARARIVELTGEHEDAIAKLNEKAASDLAEIKGRAEAAGVAAQQKYDALDLDLNTKLRDQAENHRIATETALEKSNREAAEAKAAHDAEVARIERAAADAKAEHEAEVDRLEREAVETKVAHDAEVARLQQEHRDEVEKLTAAHTDLVNRMQARFDALGEYIPVVAAENQQIGKAKGIAVTSAYIDAAKSEDADLIRVKKLAASIVPPVALSVDPRTIDLDDGFWSVSEPAKSIPHEPAPVEGYSDEPTEKEDHRPAPESEPVQELPVEQQEPEESPFAPAPVEAESDADNRFDDDDDEFGAEDLALPPFNPEPIAKETTAPASFQPMPSFQPPQSQDVGPTLPPFNPYGDTTDDSAAEDSGSGLPAFSYQPEPEPAEPEAEKADDPASDDDEFNSVGTEDFAFAKKLQ